MEPLNLIFTAIAALVGFPALVAALINLAKFVGLPDGYATKLSTALWLLAFVGVSYLVFVGKIDLLAQIDLQLGALANFLLAFAAFAAEIGLTKLFHAFLRGVPVIGFSYTDQ